MRVLGCENSFLGEVKPLTPPTEMIIEQITEFSNSLQAYEPVDEVQSQQSSCTSTEEVTASDNTAESEGDGIETVTMAEIKPAEQPEDYPNIRRKSFLKRLGLVEGCAAAIVVIVNSTDFDKTRDKFNYYLLSCINTLLYIMIHSYTYSRFIY